MELEAIRALVASDLAQTDKLIDDCLTSQIDLIKQLANHIIHSGGKRLRPLIVLLTARAIGYQGQQHTKLATIIELVHTATLLHDDVVDTSDLRRGQKTANAVWGNAASVLVGDFLYSRTFQLMVEVDSLPVLKILADSTNTISEGEILQLQNCRNPDVDEARYLEVISTKTGALFATAAQVVPVLCQRPEKEITAALNYGLQLGVAFQLIDDALDYSAETVTLGKNRGDDLAEGKPTLPLIYALKHGTPAQINSIRNAIQNACRDELEVILQAIESTGALDYTYQHAAQYAENAIKSLSVFPDSPYREALISLARFAVARAY